MHKPSAVLAYGCILLLTTALPADTTASRALAQVEGEKKSDNLRRCWWQDFVVPCPSSPPPPASPPPPPPVAQSPPESATSSPPPPSDPRVLPPPDQSFPPPQGANAFQYHTLSGLFPDSSAYICPIKFLGVVGLNSSWLVEISRIKMPHRRAKRQVRLSMPLEKARL